MTNHIANPAAVRGYPAGVIENIISAAQTAEAKAAIRQWPEYAPTPLLELKAAAREWGLSAVFYKDESKRLGLKSFKALGGAYAAQVLLAREVAKGKNPADVTVAAATDGNHGRALAWGAKRGGCRCVIYIHAGVSQARAAALEALGAEVIRIDGDYDESVRRAAADCKQRGWILVSDTSSGGGDEAARLVMAGYSLIADECRAQKSESPPTHIFIPAACGGLAAGFIADYWRAAGDARPRFIVVQSELAPGIFQSIASGAMLKVDVTDETIMAGLSCGEPSPMAWEILRLGGDDFVTVADADVADVMRRAREGEYGEKIAAGECAAAGIIAVNNAAVRDALQITAASRALIIGSEGATDPQTYRALAGGEPPE